MRKALEEAQYSAVGSVVDTDTDDDDHEFKTKSGELVRVDRSAIVSAMRKRMWVERMSTGNIANSGGPKCVVATTPIEKEDTPMEKKKRKKPKRTEAKEGKSDAIVKEAVTDDLDEAERDEGSIFAQTTGSSNATWVECDKCKKVRTLKTLWPPFAVLSLSF